MLRSNCVIGRLLVLGDSSPLESRLARVRFRTSSIKFQPAHEHNLDRPALRLHRASSTNSSMRSAPETESLGDGLAIDRLNRKLARDPRVESVLLPIADGLHLARKRQAGES